jgi:hypothetical protein
MEEGTKWPKDTLQCLRAPLGEEGEEKGWQPWRCRRL